MSCSQCGKDCKALKRCSRCKQASYCGTECQNAAWKGHKKSCVTLEDVFEKVKAAYLREDWREILKWEGRMEEMLEHQTDAFCHYILAAFVHAHGRAFVLTGSRDNALSVVRLGTRLIEVSGKRQRFRDQGEELCIVADQLLGLCKDQEAEGYFQRARKIAEAHGFFSVECDACLGLGKLAMAVGDQEEGVELLRNALVCVPLCEENDTNIELNVLQIFTDALFHTHAIDEVEPLVTRYLEAAKAKSQKQGHLLLHELRSLLTSARLHEVPCSCPPRWVAPPPCSALSFHQGR